jgi:peptide/nickel transport system substrate-binding protein
MIFRPIMAILTIALAAACGPPSSLSGASARGPSEPAKKTSLTIGIAAPIGAFSYAFTGTSGGGARAFNEVWLQGLVTSGQRSTAPEPRIAAELPSLDRGSAQVLPDGRMRVTWKIRPDVKWADGTDLTAHDYAFGFEILKDPENPVTGATQVVNIGPLVESLEVVDDKSLVLNWVRPFYKFDSMGFYALQPMPRHVLQPVWAERNMEAFANHSYWRADFFQVGPFRPVTFEPQVEIVLAAVPHYFLGKPKLDTITIKQYGDANVVFSAVLSRAIELTADNSLNQDHAVQLKEQWERTGEGKVYIGYGTSRGIFPMFRPEHQAEPAMLDPRMRQALFRAVDREAWASVTLAGYTRNIAYGMLPRAHPLFEFTEDSLRGYVYDPEQAMRTLADVGWTRAADGALTNREDGRRFKVEIRIGQGSEGEASILADMWKKIGVDSPLSVTAVAQQANRQLRVSYTGVEINAQGYGDLLLTRAECSTVPEPPRFAGANTGHYCNPEMDRLIGLYRAGLTQAEQGRAIANVAAFHAQDLPMMQLYFNLTRPAVAKGLNALADDFDGAIEAGGYYGSYFRNSHLWEWNL